MIFSIVEGVSPAIIILLSFIALLTVYVVYQRLLHPLARFPGPFLAGLTEISKFSYFWSLQIDRKLFALHEKYGPIVRIGPNELSFYGAEAVAPIYKSGRVMPKSHFYDGFTTFKPNLFGNLDEDVRLSSIFPSRTKPESDPRLKKTSNGPRLLYSFHDWNGNSL